MLALVPMKAPQKEGSFVAWEDLADGRTMGEEGGGGKSLTMHGLGGLKRFQKSVDQGPDLRG